MSLRGGLVTLPPGSRGREGGFQEEGSPPSGAPRSFILLSPSFVSLPPSPAHPLPLTPHLPLTDGAGSCSLLSPGPPMVAAPLRSEQALQLAALPAGAEFPAGLPACSRMEGLLLI